MWSSLSLFSFKLQYDHVSANIEDALSFVEAAQREISGSKNLRTVR